MGEIKKYRTGINFIDFIVSMFFVYIAYIVVKISLDSPFLIKSTNITVFIISYFFLSHLVNYLIISDEKLVVIYFFRIFRRKIELNYCDISKVTLIHIAHKNSTPRIKIETNRKIKFLNQTFSFPINFLKKRTQILKLIDSKKIPIEIISDFEKDFDILG